MDKQVELLEEIRDLLKAIHRRLPPGRHEFPDTIGGDMDYKKAMRGEDLPSSEDVKAYWDDRRSKGLGG